MTKEDILDGKEKYAWECDESEHVITYSEAEKAMDEWAKHISLEFDVWKRENCITYDYDNKSYSKLVFLDVDHTKVRTEQLSIDDTYNQFIEQQNKS